MQKKKKKKTITICRFNYNISVQKWYEAALKDLSDKMTRETNRRLIALFNKPFSKEYIEKQDIFTQDASISSQSKILLNKLRDKFASIFSKFSAPTAQKMIFKEAKVSQNTLQRGIKDLNSDLTIKGKLIPPGMGEALTAALQENIDLIKSIPEQYMNQISGSVMRAITAGGDQEQLVKSLKKYQGITERRAENIAADQTRKAFNLVNRERMRKTGIKKFQWIHSAGGQTPRPLHIQLSGEIFDIDNPPIIDDKTGEKGYPGQLPNCRCTMAAVIDFEDEN